MSTDRGPLPGGGSVGNASRINCAGWPVSRATSGYGKAGVPTCLPTSGEVLAQVVARDEPVPRGVRAFEAAVRQRPVQDGATTERAAANLAQRCERARDRRASVVVTCGHPPPPTRR